MKRFLVLVLALSLTGAGLQADTPPGLPDPSGKKKEEPAPQPLPKPVPPKTTPEESGVGSAEPAGNDKLVNWTDPVTNFHYMYIPKKRTFTRTGLACGNRGWDIFNLKYLSVEEVGRFYQSDIYKAIPWRTLFKGEPGEISEATVWNSTEFRDYSPNAQASHFKKLKVEERARVVIEERTQGGMDNGPQYTSICMYRGPEWFMCSGDRVCKSYGLTSGGKYFYEMSSNTTGITEYGTTEQDAIAWISIGSTYRSPDHEMPRRSCELLKSSVRCERLR